MEELSKLTVLEAADLVKQLETKWGVSAAAPVAVALLRPPVAPPRLRAAKDTFDVILVSVPADKKIATIKAVREVKAGLSDWRKPRRWWKARPKPVLEGANKADTDAAKKEARRRGRESGSQVIGVLDAAAPPGGRRRSAQNLSKLETGKSVISLAGLPLNAAGLPCVVD